MVVTGSYEVVGFDGLPVKGGIGCKPAIVRDAVTGQYAVIAAGRPLRWVSEGAINEAVERGLVTRLPGSLGAWAAGDCVAYVDVQHIATPWGGMLLEQIKARSILMLPCGWVWCEPAPDALARLGTWAELFLGSAEARFTEGWDMHSAGEQFAAVVSDVDRARFCITAVGEGARGLRRRAAVLLAAAYWRGGRFDDAALWLDLSLDFKAGELDGIKSDAIAEAVGSPTRPSLWIDGLDFIRKEERACT